MAPGQPLLSDRSRSGTSVEHKGVTDKFQMGDVEDGARRWAAWRLETAVLKIQVKGLLYSLFEGQCFEMGASASKQLWGTWLPTGDT